MFKCKNQKLFNLLLRKIFKLQKLLLQAVYSLLRSFFVSSRRQRRQRQAGFVLPTVTMVLLVAVLLTIAIMLRSFDRSKNASNVRVNQVVLNAAAPALDRARAKLNEVLQQGNTPTDSILYNALSSNRYVLGDETRLKVAFDINGNGTIERQPGSTYVLENNETLNTAWKFPVDTDNNGKFDSYTLYGIYFRSPTLDTSGNFNRQRNSLEARTSPMDGGNFSGQCTSALGTSSGFIGTSNWYKTGAKLTKNFFVYTANVPITDIGSLNVSQYEQYKGNKGFSALELQQDRVRIPLNNHAAWYEDDIEISYGTIVCLNGRVFTNSNLMVGGNPSASYEALFYQVSDPDSCYYQQENSKIVVGGNVANGDIGTTSDLGLVEVHRFQGQHTAPAGQNNTSNGISSTNKTTTQSGGALVGYNNNAYSQRIGLMKQAALGLHVPPIPLAEPTNVQPTIASVSSVARYPQEVKDGFAQRFNDPNETKAKSLILKEELETYLEEHTRGVPYTEVSSSTSSAVGSYTVANVLGSTSPIRPPDTWMAIEDPTSGSTTNYTNLPLNFGTGTMNLTATEPTQQQKGGKENFIGDRILVGNNLPFFWPKYASNGSFSNFAAQGEPQPVKNASSSIYWNDPSTGNATSTQRTRQSQIQFLPDLGSVERNGFWETQAAKQPAANENSGGLRVLTGAGVYIDGVPTPLGTGVRKTDPLAVATPSLAKSFLPATALNTSVVDPPKFTTASFNTNNNNIIVWSDLMPMWDGNLKGDLQMRATAFYHYKQGSAATTGPGQIDANQIPIACVSSYYDPTNQTTARNLSGLPDASATYDTNGNGTNDTLADGSNLSGSNNGQSNNGVTYNAPYTNDAGRIAAVSTYRDKLNKQARMIFPSGRIVNASLRTALYDIDGGITRSLADNTALDTAICALKILDGTLSVQTSPSVPHGAIKEAAFLDARQVKSLDNNVNSSGNVDNSTGIAETQAALAQANTSPTNPNTYTLPLEQRQPLEIRVTELDLNLLRNQAIGTATNSSNVPTNDQEYLLPNSGIIYANRDDALPDLSDTNADPTTQALLSATDFKLDSTRRPNGIRLINGSNLARNNFYRIAEKGLILATNLPAYIKGDTNGGFNLHKDPSSGTAREEFIDQLSADWSNFYTRNASLDQNFACRQNQTGCSGSGDQWRPATIISDAQTLLSSKFWDGFRNQGDYDLNNNQGNSAISAHLHSGFWSNNFVTSAQWVGTNGYPSYYNSYLTNGVSPIQRRANFPEYVMEICRLLPVSQCDSDPKNWVVGTAASPTSTASSLIGTAATNLLSGTTAKATINAVDQRYVRRVAFLRDSSGNLLDKNNTKIITATQFPVPPGIDGSGKVQKFPYDGSGNTPQSAANALWFKTTTNYTTPTTDNPNSFGVNPLFIKQMPSDPTGQPLLIPVLQIHYPTGTPQTWNPSTSGYQNTNWLQQATTTTANAAFVTGDSPARSTPSERGGGLQNFVRFLENWLGQTAQIKGSFIQYQRSSYASAPFFPVDSNATDPSSGLFYSLNGGYALYMSGFGVTGFRYRTQITDQRASYYIPPTRAYGFDVALLSQSPDLFAQKFTLNPTSSPNEYFREMGQDDSWIQALLCAAQASDRVGGSGATYTTPAFPARPSTCLTNLPYPANP